MTNADRPLADDWDPDVSRVSQELAGRLRARGLAVFDSDSPEDVLRLTEAVEEFERAVQSRGGDLMVDEPPAQGAIEPDDPHFVLPTRAADESVASFSRRVREATAVVRRHPPQP
jgi:broad specificity phosphatase PhoE